MGKRVETINYKEIYSIVTKIFSTTKLTSNHFVNLSKNKDN